MHICVYVYVYVYVYAYVYNMLVFKKGENLVLYPTLFQIPYCISHGHCNHSIHTPVNCACRILHTKIK